MNVRLADGSARCDNHMDSANYEGLTNDACAYCPAEIETIEEVVETEAPKTIEISTRYDEQITRIVGHRSRSLQQNVHHTRTINGTAYEFTQRHHRDGSRSISVTVVETGRTVHHFRTGTQVERRAFHASYVQSEKEGLEALNKLLSF